VGCAQGGPFGCAQGRRGRQHRGADGNLPSFWRMVQGIGEEVAHDLRQAVGVGQDWKVSCFIGQICCEPYPFGLGSDAKVRYRSLDDLD